MNDTELREHLTYCLQVPYPLITMVTWEEGRAVDLIRESSAAAGLECDAHSCRAEESGAPALIALLDELADLETPHVTIIRDAYPYLDDPIVLRRLRDLVPRLAARKQALVLTAPVARIPVELHRDMYLLELPLPTSEQIQTLAEAQLKSADSEWVEQAVRAARGLTLDECTRLFARIQAEGGLKEASDLDRVIEEKRRLMKMSDLIELCDQIEDLTAVGGLSQLKEWLQSRARAFGEEARAFGLPQPRGLLLLGVQGCGKSLTAKAIASHWQLPLARFDMGQLFRSVASPEESLRHVLRMVESLSPLILWIDEIDKSFQGVGDGGSEAIHRVFATFITWMQEKREPVFVVATANEVSALPPELLRKGRFDEIFFVDLPDVHEREAILRIHLKAHSRAPENYDLTALAARAEQFSGAELAQSIVSALYDAFAEGRELEQDDLLRALSETVPLYFTYEESIKDLREWARNRARMASSDSKLIDLFEETGPS